MLRKWKAHTLLSSVLETKYPVVGLITGVGVDGEGKVEERTETSDLGGTMRLGSQLCHLAKKKVTNYTPVARRSKNVTVTVTKWTTIFVHKLKKRA